MEFYKIYICSLVCLLGWVDQVTSSRGIVRDVRDRNRGALVGKLQSTKHNVHGVVYVVDEDTLYIEDFHYDGKGTDAYFWVGTSGYVPNDQGKIVNAMAVKSTSPMPRFTGQNLLLILPNGIKVPKDLKWFSVWSKSLGESYGHVKIRRSLDVPQKTVLPEFSRLAHELRSGNITILDAKRFYIPNLYYDGLGPDAFFWVGTTPTPDEYGIKIPNEKGTYDLLTAYNGESIVLTLPNQLTVYDITYLSMWCIEFKHNFGHVLIPDNLWVPPSIQ